jgi:hypothetical protein
MEQSKPRQSTVVERCLVLAAGDRLSCLAGTVTVAGRVTVSSPDWDVVFRSICSLHSAVRISRALIPCADWSITGCARQIDCSRRVDFDKPLAQIGLKKHPLGQYGLYAFFDAGNVA